MHDDGNQSQGGGRGSADPKVGPARLSWPEIRALREHAEHLRLRAEILERIARRQREEAEATEQAARGDRAMIRVLREAIERAERLELRRLLLGRRRAGEVAADAPEPGEPEG